METSVLLIEPDPTAAQEITEILQEGGFLPVTRQSFEAVHDSVTDEMPPKAILIGTDNVKESVLSFISELKADPSTQWIPLFILSRTNEDSFRIDCFNAGADEFFLKPIHPKELLARLRGWVNRIGNFEESAFRDPLTKAYNRRYFDLHILLELQKAQKNDYPISVAFIDADKFKSINDNYGHHVGDLVLQGLSKILREKTRTSDLVARYGGEEFVILFPKASGDQAANRIQTILEYVRENPVAEYEGQLRHITFSCGVAEWKPGLSVTEWVKLADDGVYEAKGQGRNRVILSNLQTSEHDHLEEKKKVLIVAGKGMSKSIVCEIDSLAYEIQEWQQGIEEVPPEICIYVIPPTKGFDAGEYEQFRMKHLPKECKTLLLTENHKALDSFQIMATGIDGYLRGPYLPGDIELGLRRLTNLN
ncbi:GGDEF domain-containing response regulator [Paenibacillus abyssi]|uniref:Diguanylate cyclase n=1 Tax=Paenibacillus abyssi TaxID=1340531 RepID=A0A917G2D4_9BACL|nr:diguanylate cyclase [Paenibacillus abyssi]GGG18767.1 hypothetical protein GCM10010916_39450 [Paenibacillus abyssi]